MNSGSHKVWPLMVAHLEKRGLEGFDISGAMHAMRNPDVLCQPEALARLKDSALCPAWSIIDRVRTGQWRIARRRLALDEDGRGCADYYLDLDGWRVQFHVISDFVRDMERAGRLSDNYFDGRGVLFAYPPTSEELEDQRNQLGELWNGRASQNALGWTLANRSVANFDNALEALREGSQPPLETWHPSSRYLMRNAGFYGNGKLGSRLWKSLETAHPLRKPYFPEMLSLLLWRQFGFDILDHLCTRAGYPILDRASRQGIGLGNSSGMGMMGVLTRWPWWVDAWVSVREACVALLRAMPESPNEDVRETFQRDIERRYELFREGEGLDDPPHIVPTAVVANDLKQFRSTLNEEMVSKQAYFRRAFEVAERDLSPEGVESVYAAALSSIPDLVEVGNVVIEELMEPVVHVDSTQKVQGMIDEISSRYDWVWRLNHVRDSAPYYFLYKSIQNGEHRRGIRGVDHGTENEVFIDVPSAIEELMAVLGREHPDSDMGSFVYRYPEYRDLIERVHSTRNRTYAEFRDRCTRKEFLPLWIIRFYLTMFGLQLTDPKNTRWVRGVFFRGAPTIALEGGDGD